MPNLIVETLADVVGDSDGLTSLRVAVAATNAADGVDEIRFADCLSGLIRLTQSQIDITGDANRDDITEQGTDITDSRATRFGGLGGDNSRVFNIGTNAPTEPRGLTLTGGFSVFGGRGASTPNPL